MQKLLLVLFFLITSFYFSSSICQAVDYYVATSGNDANPGTASQPWKTIQKAASNVTAGDRVTVQPGTYPEEVTVSSSGSSNNLIQFSASDAVTVRGFHLNGNYILLRGFTVSAPDCNNSYGTIDIKGQNNVVENNTVINSSRQGIIAQYNSSNTTIRNNTISYTISKGIRIRGQNNRVIGNDISHILDHTSNCNENDADGIVFMGPGHLIQGNYIHDFVWSDQNHNPHLDAFQTYDDTSNTTYPSAKNTIIERNRVFMGITATRKLEPMQGSNSISGFMVEGSASYPCQGLVIRNNIIEAHMGLNIGSGGNVQNISLYNNTWHGDLSFANSPRAINLWQSTTGYQIFNNLIIDYAVPIRIGSGVTGGSYDYNLMWNSNGSTPGPIGYNKAAHDQVGVNPQVVDFTQGGDFHLKASSPAIDKGNPSSSPSVDYEGNTRPLGNGFDIGAYEYTGGVQPSPSPTPTPSSSPTPSPSPTPPLSPTPTPPSNPYDLNGNGQVNAADVLILLDNWRNGSQGDFNSDGKVNGLDFGMLIANWGT